MLAGHTVQAVTAAGCDTGPVTEGETPRRRGPNRGPAAAAANRAALLAAARRLFAERGYHVPLAVVAREAGVGQASLYRHFPRRLDLALAIFEDNIRELERIGEDPGPQTFQRLWRTLAELTLEYTAFVEMVVDLRRQVDPAELSADRVRAVLQPALTRAQAAGLADPDLDVADVMLVQRMLYGVAVTEPDPADARAAALRAARLVDPRLAWDGES